MVLIGQSKGQTVLPLPHSSFEENKGMRLKDKVHILESAVITWAQQIKNVLNADPEAALKVGTTCWL